MTMKKTLLVLTALALLLPAYTAGATTPCKKREAAIEAELANAKQNNKAAVSGLEEALANHRASCNDDDLVSKLKMKVEEKKLKVSKAELEVKEAKATGKADKISSKELKLQEARIDLKEAEASLAAVQ